MSLQDSPNSPASESSVLQSSPSSTHSDEVENSYFPYVTMYDHNPNDIEDDDDDNDNEEIDNEEEINGSITSYVPKKYNIYEVDIPLVNYSRVRKSFKNHPTDRIIDPRLRRIIGLPELLQTSPSRVYARPLQQAATAANLTNLYTSLFNDSPSILSFMESNINDVMMDSDNGSDNFLGDTFQYVENFDPNFLENTDWYKSLSWTNKIKARQNFAPLVVEYEKFEQDNTPDKSFNIGIIFENPILENMLAHLKIYIDNNGNVNHLNEHDGSGLTDDEIFSDRINDNIDMFGNACVKPLDNSMPITDTNKHKNKSQSCSDNNNNINSSNGGNGNEFDDGAKNLIGQNLQDKSDWYMNLSSTVQISVEQKFNETDAHNKCFKLTIIKKSDVLERITITMNIYIDESGQVSDIDCSSYDANMLPIILDELEKENIEPLILIKQENNVDNDDEVPIDQRASRSCRRRKYEEEYIEENEQDDDKKHKRQRCNSSESNRDEIPSTSHRARGNVSSGRILSANSQTSPPEFVYNTPQENTAILRRKMLEISDWCFEQSVISSHQALESMLFNRKIKIDENGRVDYMELNPLDDSFIMPLPMEFDYLRSPGLTPSLLQTGDGFFWW